MFMHYEKTFHIVNLNVNKNNKTTSDQETRSESNWLDVRISMTRVIIIFMIAYLLRRFVHKVELGDVIYPHVHQLEDDTCQTPPTIKNNQ